MSAASSPKRGRPALDAIEIARLRATIVDAAALEFAANGARATTVDDVARAAGVSRATVYRYAGGRDDLIVQVALRRFDEWVDGVVNHASTFDSVADIITEAILWTVRTVTHDPSLGALFAGGTANAASDVLTERSASHATSSWRLRFGAVLAAHDHEIRPGLSSTAVADRVMSVLLDELGRRRGRDEQAIRDWVTTWLLPAVLVDRPALPEPRSPRSTQTPVA